MKKDQLQIGNDSRVELQIPPSAKLDFRGAEKNLLLGGETYLYKTFKPPLSVVYG
mgnify:CR=1 FL=1